MKYVLDTSAFTSVQKTAPQTLRHINKLAQTIHKDSKNKYYIPPSVWQELEKILHTKKTPKKTIQLLEKNITTKQASRMELLIPSQFIHDYVKEVRERFNRGLRAAEKAVQEKSKNKNRPDTQVIRDLRQQYRTAIRKGILDSQEDLDVILLAKELRATIAANDQGIKEWAHKWGIPYTNSTKLLTKLSK